MSHSIEEVWEREITSLCLVDFLQQEVEEATRAVVLAVLEEAFDVPVLVDSIYVARRAVDKLRRRLQALGGKP